MPYIIETREPRWERGRAHGTFNVARHAVATLEEAQEACRVAVLDARGWDRDADGRHAQYDALRHQTGDLLAGAGGTVGPLPDGTIIEVKHLTDAELAAAAGTLTFDEAKTLPQAALVDAYNVAQ